MLTALVLWLTIAATSAWANVQAEIQSDRDENGSSGYLLATDEDATSAASLEGMADEVKLRDGSVVKPQRLPRRAPSEDYAYTYKGVKYTYITENNYTRFFNLSVHTPKDYGWYPDDDGWYVNAEKDYITAASIDEESVPANAEVAILNDLVGFFTSHTHLGCIADHGFTGESKVKRIYFQDCDAMAYSSNTNPYFFIGHLAFANAPHLEKVDLMYYVTSGDNRWEPMPVSAVKRIWDNMLEGSSKAQLRVASSTLNDYKNSGVWTALKDRFVSYEPSGYEINEYGARYKCMLAEDNKTYLTNDGSLTDEVMKQLRLWNADYQGFNARQLMADDADATIYYTTIEGVDNDYLRNNDGLLRIYNDVGSYYNYKTLAIRRGAFAYCEDLKNVEFWQTNGRSENSYSDLKICIENGAFRGCKNLEEIRLYYHVQDGKDHWESLGPEDVIPGDDIFGWKASCDEQGDFLDPDKIETIEARIVVAPERYIDFLNDPNWSQYRDYIVAADYAPTNWSPLTEGGLTYDYVSKSGNALSTDQVVTVNTSWWTAVYIAAEIAIMWATWGSGNTAANTATQTARKTIEQASTQISLIESDEIAIGSTLTIAKDYSKGQLSKMATKTVIATKQNFKHKVTELFEAAYKKLSSETQKELWDAIIGSGVSSWNNLCWDTTKGVSKDQLMKLGNAMLKYLNNRLIQTAADRAAQEAIIAKAKSEIMKQGVLSIAKQTMKNTLKGTAVASFMGSRFLPLYLTMNDEANESQMEDAMIENMKSNIHQVGMVGIGFTTPDKKLVYHTYISQVDPEQTDFTIYNDVGSAYNYRTMGVKRRAFQGNTKVKSIKFAESRGSSYDSYAPLLFSIPDSAFARCTNLEVIDLRYQTAKGGETALGPENFVLTGDSIFAGCDSTKLRIIVGEDRYQDFLDNESWAKYKRYLSPGKVAVKKATSGYGVNYAYVYDNNTTRHISYGMGHEIEHLYAYEADDSFLKSNSGALGLFNDVGNWNNYHLDYAKKGAFRDNQNLKEVSFWNVNGLTIFGEAYADINITLQDSCFKNCQNLESMGLVFLSHSGTLRGSVKPLTPNTLRLGDGVFENTPKLKLKVMPQQMEAFMADSAWASYKDKFVPCLFKPIDSKVKSVLSDLRYTLHCSTMNNTWDIVDAMRLKEKGFSWLNGRFSNKSFEEFPEFKNFESVGLDYIGGSWFVGCSNLRNIELPSTIKKIGGYAFQNCYALPSITIPAAVEQIDEYAFTGAGLKTVHCEGKTPAQLGSYVFYNCHSLSKIYVPAESVEAYKEKWSQYKDYIVSETEMPVIHYVKTTKAGELAEKLGLSTKMDGKFLTGLVGYYQNIDSLVVEGPLNGVDVGVLRFLGGANVNNSEPTAGRLHYLNLYGAQIKKDMEHPYQCWGGNDYLEEDDKVGDFMFTYCDKLKTVILPKTAKKIGENVFENAYNLKHLAIGDETVEADNELFEDGTERLEELVFLKNLCTSNDKTCWSPGAEVVYVPYSLLGDFMGRNELTSSSQGIAPIFKDNEAHRCFVSKGHFFPSSYMKLKNIDGILNDKVKSFDELYGFREMTDLGAAFNGCSALERVTLPDSLKSIGYSAFAGCNKLGKITVSADSVPALEEGAFRDLPADFCIYVPKTHIKRYREAWIEYADHIVGDKINTDNIIEVTVYRENTLGEALGLKVSTQTYSPWYDEYKKFNKVVGVSGDYRNITRLKVNGPISGKDIALLRYLAGFCPWADRPNMAGALEYIDLYDANLVPSNVHFAQDKLTTRTDCVDQRDVLPAYAFLQCYRLKTLILPKSLKEIRSRSIMQCEDLETVVIGDDIETINWSAFDDDVSLTRMYLLAKKKPKMDADNFVWRNLCNNYNPTFDAFYVRPSLYNEYIVDNDYVGTSWQRTNNISTGIFKNEEDFLCFGAHAAATEDDLTNVTDVSGWFKNHTGITDLTPLRYTLVGKLNTSDMKPLTRLERISLPMTLEEVDEDAFSNAKNLRFADFQLCDSINYLMDGGLRRLGLDENVLCYVPAAYGETDEVNVAVGDSTVGFRAKTFRLYDGKDYCVPYALKAENVENTRTLAKSDAPYTVCLPYELDIPADTKVYKLSGRSDNELIFAQTTERMEALQPYLIWAEDNDASLDASGDVSIPVSGGSTYGRQRQSPGFVMRGTLDTISNQEAAELGAYVMNDDAKWHPVLSDTEAHKAADIPAFRCYLLQSRNGRSRTAIGMSLEDATGIEQMRTIDADGTERVYDLSGRRIGGNTKGIVIKNGHKIIQK